MAAQKDMQDLLRLLTTGRNKLPMLGAMQRVKALQVAGLKSINDIATNSLTTITKAVSDEKAAKALLAACKAHIKDPSTSSKRPSTSSDLSPTSKRLRATYGSDTTSQTPQELEASLALPQPSKDEEAIEKCVIYTNRAPLVLAFAVKLLEYTMPEQPLSSRLSLGQAVCSANSRSKAVSLGIEKGKGAEGDGWGMGQPKVRILGREVSVLKRTGYEWKEEKGEKGEKPTTVGESSSVKDEEGGEEQSQATMKAESQDTSESDTKIHPLFSKGGAASKVGWTTSSTITSKQSTFIARSIIVTSPTQAKATINALTSTHPSLKTASHNITAYRIILPSGSILEDSNDDGESKAGACILRVLKDHNLTNVLLVVSRWYGGIFLGPDRFRIMTDVAKDALAQRLRVVGAVGQEALWGLDLEGMQSENSPVTGDSLPIHRPEGARAYIMKAFACPPEPEVEGKKKKKTAAQAGVEKEENLGMLFGALDLLFGSWVQHIGKDELDRRAWGWYVNVRPEVEGGVAGWGGKGNVKLSDILALRRKE
ncbi:hypothetical protein B0J14DRAFT_559784 [Halenospora varia]|nr:hypothetical protein B0J14DRAFT_559784 [Halenospora varia]